MTRSIATELIDLSHALGSRERDWAILGEGNASARVDDRTFLVKATGARLERLQPTQISELQFAPLIEAVASEQVLTDAENGSLLEQAKASPSGPTPSVESLFHADLLSFLRANFIGHTHVASINSLLCSERGWDALASGGRLFPDEIVVCGPAPCCVEYFDPGLALARAIHGAAADYCERRGVAPKTIYLRNHGFIAIGATADEVLGITEMADKAARILLGTFSCGGPRYLGFDDAKRIDSRPDEHVRQRVLGLVPSETSVGTNRPTEETR